MAKKYNRKRFLEENSSDNSPSIKKINFEKTNRQDGKREVKQEVENYSKNLSKDERKELIWETEMKLASECYNINKLRKEQGLPEKCDCPLPERLTNEELYEILSR